jgi:hypothetical protein
MLVGEPAKLLANADLARAFERLIPAARLQRFSDGSGIDLKATPSALAAGFDYSTLYIAATPESGSVAEHRFIERLVSGPISVEPVPGLRRLSGVVGTTPQTLLHIERLLVAVAVGDPTPTRVVEAYARGKLKKSPTALRGSALSALPAEMHAPELRFYAPGPFSGEWAVGARGLLAAAVALGIAATPLPAGQIAVQVHVAGDFGSDGEARTTLLSAWRDLSESPLGRLLGFDRPVSEPVLSAARDLLTLEVVLEIEPIARGLHAAVSADVWEMLELPAPNPRR